MNKETIARRVAESKKLKGLARNTGSRADWFHAEVYESMLLLDFIRHVEATGPKRLRALASEVLKVRGI